MVMEPHKDQDQPNTHTSTNGKSAVRHLGLAIRRDGVWLYQGSPIQRLPLVKLFASVLKRAEDGRYWLVTPVERGVIDVEDAPFVGIALEVEEPGPQQTIRLRTNLEHWVTIGPGHPLVMRRPPFSSGSDLDELAPYVTVKEGLEARLNRPTFYDLVELGSESEVDGVSRFGVLSQGHFFGLDRATT